MRLPKRQERLLTKSCLELMDKCLFSLLLDGPGISTNDIWKQKKVKHSKSTIVGNGSQISASFKTASCNEGP